MCEHHHNQPKENNIQIFIRILLAVCLFAGGFKYPALFIPAYLIAGYDVLLKALLNILKGKIFDENFLMAIATLGALCIHEYPEAVMVMVLYQIGEYLQDMAVEKSRDSITKLMDIRPDYANINDKRVSPYDVKIGDIITVYPGEKIPMDGIVIEGEASIDSSALTGEAIPNYTKPGNSVLSGGVNLNSVLKIRVTKEFRNSTASKILELIEDASARKAETENFITRFAKYYTPAVVIIALIIALIPPFYIERALTFLVISCPCALVISIPLSFFAGIGGASKRGILIKGASYLEALAETGVVVFDKTGTLTRGEFRVVKICSEKPEILRYAAAAESASSHPIAAAIKKAYGENINNVSEVKEFAGLGVSVCYENKNIKAGNSKFIGVESVNAEGTIVYVSVNNEYYGYIVISDEIKDDSKNAIYDLKKLGIKTYMLTGDRLDRAKSMQKELNIDNISADLLPADKVRELEKIILGTSGKVIFTGDGINDAPVLARADIGIAMGGIGSDAAIEAADIVIMDDKPSKVYEAIKISKKTMRITRENIVFALTVKLLFLILGCMGLITMWGAVFADTGVSIIAILNALRCIKF